MKMYSVGLLLSFYVIAFLGCGADEEAAFEVSDKAPVVSVEKLGDKLGQKIAYSRDDNTQVVVMYKVVADTAPKTDLLVNMYISGKFYRLSNTCKYSSDSFWVTIPKGKKESQEFEYKGWALNGYIAAGIEPLPVVSIVGEGEVIDQQSLQGEYGGRFTEDKQRIPEDFVFPYYEVANSESILLYRAKAANIISVDPPNGSSVTEFSDVTITFDTPPECPNLITNLRESFMYGGGTTFTLKVGYLPGGILSGVGRAYDFTIRWGDEEAGTDASQKFRYIIFH